MTSPPPAGRGRRRLLCSAAYCLPRLSPCPFLLWTTAPDHPPRPPGISRPPLPIGLLLPTCSHVSDSLLKGEERPRPPVPLTISPLCCFRVCRCSSSPRPVLFCPWPLTFSPNSPYRSTSLGPFGSHQKVHHLSVGGHTSHPGVTPVLL